jgi:predicted thioesterase
LELGGKAERTQIVEKEHTLDKRKIPGMEILSTPALIKWLEDTCAEIVGRSLKLKYFVEFYVL